MPPANGSLPTIPPNPILNPIHSMSSSFDQFASFRKYCLVPAFAKLRKKGIFASCYNIQCCGPCGHAFHSHCTDCGSYVFYHSQSSALFSSVVPRGALKINYSFASVEDMETCISVLSMFTKVEFCETHGLYVKPKRSWVAKDVEARRGVDGRRAKILR